jgi:hypothetical protein
VLDYGKIHATLQMYPISIEVKYLETKKNLLRHIKKGGKIHPKVWIRFTYKALL